MAASITAKITAKIAVANSAAIAVYTRLQTCAGAIHGISDKRTATHRLPL
ncbi:MAG: hypothetical protein ABIT83_20800 [Massilia sp.]